MDEEPKTVREMIKFITDQRETMDAWIRTVSQLTDAVGNTDWQDMTMEEFAAIGESGDIRAFAKLVLYDSLAVTKKEIEDLPESH